MLVHLMTHLNTTWMLILTTFIIRIHVEVAVLALLIMVMVVECTGILQLIMTIKVDSAAKWQRYELLRRQLA